MRTAFLETLLDCARSNKGIWLLTGDLGFSVLEPFAGQFPDRYVNTGVAEQNMIGVAAGLALSGKTVFVYSIANFPTLRCLEQVRNDICGHNLNVKIVAVGGGFSYGSLGYSHHGVEDLAILRALPHMEVIAPADPVETRVITRRIAESTGPAYIRLGKGRETAVHTGEPDLKRGVPFEMQSGPAVAVLSVGGMLETCMNAAHQAQAAGVTPGVYSCPWLKPMDREAVVALATRYDVIITVEEACVCGGLGGAVSEILAEMPAPRARLKRLGVPDTVMTKAYTQRSAREQVGMGVDAIRDAILNSSTPRAAW